MKGTVLFVDDEQMILVSLSEMFGSDYTVHTASCAEEAVKVLESQPVDVIVSDYQMPGMDGLSLLISTRECYPRLVRVLMTAFADMKLVIRALNEGQIHKFISKPFNLYELRKILADCMKIASIAPAQSSSPRPRKTVLVAHDSRITLSSLRLILSTRYNVLSTANGLDVLSLVSGNQIDALVLGVGLEMIDGCTIATYLKREKALPVPVVIWSDEITGSFEKYLAGCGVDHAIDNRGDDAPRQLLDYLADRLAQPR